MDQTFAIFTEAFEARLLPIYQEVSIGAARHFHPEQYPLLALIAAAGALGASVLLYFIGIGLRRMPERVSNADQQEKIKKMQIAASRWLPWLLILSPTPVGCILIIAAAFFRLPPRVAALAILAAEILWRISPLV